MYFNRKCKITFISNGATIFSDESRLNDKENYPPISEAGQEEVEKICNFLKVRGIKNDKIYASKGLRATQTAELISKVYKQDFTIADELKPRKVGKFSNLTLEQIEEKYPEMFDKMVRNPHDNVPEDAESIAEFIERIEKSINKIIEENEGCRIIIVTYTDVIKAAICAAMSMPKESLYRIYIKTGSATQISYFEKWNSLMYSGIVPA